MLTNSNLQIITIVCATVIPVLIIVIAIFIVGHRRRQRRYLFLKRGITPVGDEEIESWRLERSEEKAPILESASTSHPPVTPNPEKGGEAPQPLDDKTQQRQHSESVSSVRKPPSVIVYQNPQAHVSGEDLQSPRSLPHKHSIDFPTTPVQARAPNSRPGLTDETVQGDDAYIPTLKRQPSRLAKLPPLTERHTRNQSSRSAGATTEQQHDYWYGQGDLGTMQRKSSEHLPRAKRSFDVRRNHKRTHTVSHPTRMSFDEEAFIGGLSPRPAFRHTEIGRAIG